jgi:phenylalanyl-tRNA synthetase beta chain
LWLLPEDAIVGKTIREYLDLDDQLFTLKLTPNRSDCSSLFGIAREVSALTGSPCQPLDIKVASVASNEKLSVKVEDTQACPAYYGRLIHGVNAAVATPVWMQRRLERSGLRSINAVVDITNYVMLEMGQPMHAFDAQNLSGGITVRRAKKGESLTLLNEQITQLDSEVLVIADDAHVLAIAGIMGGQDSGVETSSTDVFLESAFFHPDAIVGKARRFGLATDSSFRFERGVDFAATQQAMERATQLLVEICGGTVGEISAVCNTLPTRPAIALRRSRVERILGIALSNEQIAELLTRLQFVFTSNGDDFRVSPPSFRFDMTIEADLVEELARLYGYDNIPALAPKTSLTMLPCSESQRPLNRVKQVLVSRDYQEIVSLAFSAEQTERDLCGNENPLTLQNPIASNLAVMRSSLIGGLVDALRFNLNRKQTRVRLFEVGACFAKSGEDYVQTSRLSGLAYGTQQTEQWGITARTVDFYDAKADVEALCGTLALRFVAAQHPALHPGRSAQIFVGERAIGWLGELHPHTQQQYDLPLAPVWFELDLEVLLTSRVPRLADIAKFLPVRRDLALVVDEAVNADTLLDTTSTRDCAVRCVSRQGFGEWQKKPCIPCVSTRYSKEFDGCRNRNQHDIISCSIASARRATTQLREAMTPTLTKAELSDLLFEKVGLNKREAKDMVETFFEEIRAQLEMGESVKLSGFGNFELRDKPQRPGRNPKTGEEIPISARRVVTFHPSQKLKTTVEKSYHGNPQA